MPDASGRRNEQEGCQTDPALRHRGIRDAATPGGYRRGTGWHGGDNIDAPGEGDGGYLGQRGDDSSIRHTGPATKNAPSNFTNAGTGPASTQNFRSGGSLPATLAKTPATPPTSRSTR